MTHNLKILLKTAGIILEQQEKLHRIKGEAFNVFSVLGMEHLENRTHSAFIAELLDPRGSHLMGSTFLKLFLETVNQPDVVIDHESSSVVTEYYVGPRVDESKTGGRIDILVRDTAGHCLSIENKIYANDQEEQVNRYFNYKRGKNTVLYLTLRGDEPGESSRGDLIEGEDYHCISYSDQILRWLRKCHKAAVNQPILRETIRQYQILIQKLTGAMEPEEKEKLTQLVMENFEAAAFVAEQFPHLKYSVCDEFRESVVSILSSCLSSKSFIVAKGDDITKPYAQIWVRFKNAKKGAPFFGIESFNGRRETPLFIGTFIGETANSDYLTDNRVEKNNPWWSNKQLISAFDNNELIFSNPALIGKIYSSADFKERLVAHVVKECEVYIKEHLPIIKKYTEFEDRSEE